MACKYDYAQGLFEGEIKDISKGGALIQCTELPIADEPLELSIEITDHFLIYQPSWKRLG